MLPALVLFAWAHIEPDTCLAFVSRNLAKGNGNWYTYFTFSRLEVKLKAGDSFVYDIYLDPKNPVAKGGIDIDFESGELRDIANRAIKDQMGIPAHGDSILEPALGKWFTRRFSLDGAAGKTTKRFNMAFEGDIDGRYAQFIDNVRIEHADGTQFRIYTDGPPSVRQMSVFAGYTAKPALVMVDRAQVEASPEELIAGAVSKAERLWQVQDLRADLDVVRDFEAKNPEPHLHQHILEAEVQIAKLESKDDIDAEEVQAVLHTVNHALEHAHPMMAKYTGHLVGHAHIDLQWLWEWQEGLVATRDTFTQAIKFMDEFPGFTFSQSSSWLYQSVEETYPELFKQIQAKVKTGQWELVGGRVCESDTNMISPESQARQFLYGQRYFREKFGKTATVAWEPDTFGHTAQMPQIAALGGCDSYYFCRGGKGQPLFNWKALDGTSVLAFDEPASGSWYNSDLNYSVFNEMLDFEKRTSSRDMLLVYGVGNHGGGPTREHLQLAESMMKAGALPNVKFSTASQFFASLKKYNLAGIPTIQSELNPVFEGCYTTHSDVKQANRDAESWTSTAEAVAAAAHQFGFAYPRALFRRMWEDICYNHHHDTLPGSGVHAPYDKTKVMLARVVSEAKDTTMRALETLSVRVTPNKGGISAMVFNPLGWKRSGWVETYLVRSGWNGGEETVPARTLAFGPDGIGHPVEVLDRNSLRVRFYAADIPAYGYRVFQLKSDEGPIAPSLPPKPEEKGVWDNDDVRVKIDRDRGCVSSLILKSTGREMAGAEGLGRLELHFERPGEMSAWTLGAIDHIERPRPTEVTFERGSHHHSATFHYQLPGGSSASQTFTLMDNGDAVQVTLDVDWQVVGSPHELNPLLRLVCHTALSKAVATYDVPFGAISRPTDNRPVVALKWGDLSTADGGVALINDSKHGYGATADTLLVSVIRASYTPDPVPNPGQNVSHYEIIAHEGDWRDARLPWRGFEFNQPLVQATVPYDARGDAPLEWSAAQVSATDCLPTGLKLAEDDDALIVRFYEALGRTTTTTLTGPWDLNRPTVVNFIEDRVQNLTAQGRSTTLPALRPFQIVTVKLPRAKLKATTGR